MTNKENIMMPLILAGAKRKDIEQRVHQLTVQLHLEGILKTNILLKSSGVRSNVLPLHVH